MSWLSTRSRQPAQETPISLNAGFQGPCAGACRGNSEPEESTQAREKAPAIPRRCPQARAVDVETRGRRGGPKRRGSREAASCGGPFNAGYPHGPSAQHSADPPPRARKCWCSPQAQRQSTAACFKALHGWLRALAMASAVM